MEIKVYSIFDLKAETYSQPFYAMNDALAQRIFTDVARDTETNIARHPMDFVLMRIGSFDTNTGCLTSDEPLSFGSAREYLRIPVNIDIEEAE